MVYQAPGVLRGLAVNADIKAQGAGPDGFRYGRNNRAQLLRQSGGLLFCPAQPAQDQREYGLQPRQGENFRQVSVGNVSQLKTVALQRTQKMLGIHLIHDRAQRCPEPVKLFHPVFAGQAEDPLQVVVIHRTVMLHLPGQQVTGDVEQRAQGRQGCQPVMPAQEGLPGMNQHKAQLVAGEH